MTKLQPSVVLPWEAGSVQEHCEGECEQSSVKEKVNNQHGFAKGKSCLTSLIALYDTFTGFVHEQRGV